MSNKVKRKTQSSQSTQHTQKDAAPKDSNISRNWINKTSTDNQYKCKRISSPIQNNYQSKGAVNLYLWLSQNVTPLKGLKTLSSITQIYFKPSWFSNVQHTLKMKQSS